MLHCFHLRCSLTGTLDRGSTLALYLFGDNVRVLT